MYKKTKDWRNTLEAFNLIVKPKDSDAVRILTPSFISPKNVRPEYQGEYIHPKLVHFIAEYCSKVYAFKVAELMDSINENVHEQLNKQQLPDTVEISKQIFEDLRMKAIKYNMMLHHQEEAEKRANTHDVYCWGVRD